MIRVVLADDEALIRVGVRTILSADPGIEVVGEAGTGSALVALVSKERPDVALVDIRMPGGDGLSAIAELRRVSPGTAVAMLTTFGKDDYVVRALGEGASGFLLKAGDPRELIAGVRTVAAGGACLSPKLARRLADRLAREPEPADSAAAATRRLEALSPRERDVLALIGEGLSNAAIARRLHLAEDTVKTHVSSVLTRLDADNRVQAAIAAYQAGLVRG
ncbi:response regulator [Streptomonospora litoralis]|uniref:Transcriptional regulatory protein DegU n=1 Tax=Streptomonospora litoralis TaxID=2498135 RepID=A0A4P6PY74_9ACTN|nr:response regulator transcription factor [Streptomonospora litoralis]QBI53063.1 Transcriptional regulatory protein DegU [Streptomonospora litoralis]